jgi:copper chaperone CopZ
MDCADEVAILERTLKPIAGVRDVRANLMASKITVTHDARVTAQTLLDAIASTEMKATLAARCRVPKAFDSSLASTGFRSSRSPPLRRSDDILGVHVDGDGPS